ncbi:hypothetical protein [Acetonema longum]|uniref:Uncharacterized protein n=1 Tax=Acetonema longum DSM 6540 TaxID=1009370 RepID=F7NFG5_9FIRM|nr:hypothetical protein [Acetonema longum]EGO65220.1 hypothetical protein ALO_03961 [Acetonema longum DSM 6540]
MKAFLIVAALMAIPSVALAHSGTLFKIAVNYIPIILAAVPMLLKLFSKLVSKIYSFFMEEHK